jgi:lysophospholipase L1-like esterase
VLCAPYASISTAASNIQNGRDYLNDANKYRIRQNGNITRVRLRVAGVPASIIFKVWRLNGGGTFDLVGQSQDFVGSVAANTTVTIDLTTPIAVQEGDFTGIYVTGGSQTLTANTGETSATLRYFTGAAANPADFRGTGSSAANIAVPIECSMQAPSVVHIGDSRVAGHPAHYAFTESTLTTNIASTVAKQLQTLLGHDYQNMGIGSQTSTNVAARFANDVVALKPKAVVIEIGVNDVSGGVSQATFIANYTSILDACVSANIRPIILLITPWHGGTNTQAQTVDQFNAALLTLATAYVSAIVVDARQELGEDRTTGTPTPPPGNLWNGQTAYRADNVHWNATGNGVIAQVIFDTISGLETAFEDPSLDFPTPNGTTLRSRTAGDTISGTARGHSLLLRATCHANHGLAFVTIDQDGEAANLAREVRPEDFLAITNVVNNGAGACRVTAAGHGYSDGAIVRIEGVLGATGADGVFAIDVIDTNTFDLGGSTFGGTYTSGGTAGFFSQADIGRRYVETYTPLAGQYDEHIPLAEGLADGDHEIELTVVGTGRGGDADGGWISVHGFAGASANHALGEFQVTMGYWRHVANPRNRDEFHSFVSHVRFAPEAAPTNYLPLGEADANERIVSRDWKADGRTAALGPGELLTATMIGLDQAVDLEHPDVTSQPTARRIYRYTAAAGQHAGLACRLDTTWRADGVCDRIDFGLLSLGERKLATGDVVNSALTRAELSWEFRSDDAITPLDQLGADDDSILGKVTADTVTWTNEDVPIEAFVTVPNVAETLAEFARAEPLFVHVVDGADGFDRTVFTRASDIYPEAVEAGTTQRATVGWNIGRRRNMAGPFVVEAARIVSPLDRPGRHLLDTATEIEATIPTASSPAMLARVIDALSGEPLDPLEIRRASYDIELLDERDPASRSAVEGHQGVILESRDVLLSGLTLDALWGNTDAVGYNVLFIPSATVYMAFADPGRYYRTVLRLHPWSGPTVPLHFRVRTI